MQQARPTTTVILALAAALLPACASVAVAADPAAIPSACHAPFKIALDTGHTLSQPGATSATGVTEYSFNRRLVSAVNEGLAQAGVAAVLIGMDGGPLQLTDRTRLARDAGASLFLSLHHDSVQPRYLSTWTVEGHERPYSDLFRGYSVFVSDEGARPADSLRFASLLGTALLAGGFVPSLYHAEPIPGEGRPLLDRRLGILRFDKLAVLRTAAMPAVLLEAAVIVNRQEEQEARSPAFLKRMAAAVTRAVLQFCSPVR